MHGYVCIYTHASYVHRTMFRSKMIANVSVYIYIYERERERETEIYIYIYTDMYADVGNKLLHSSTYVPLPQAPAFCTDP